MRKIIQGMIIVLFICFVSFLVLHIRKTNQTTSFVENEHPYLYVNVIDSQSHRVFYQYDLKNNKTKVLLKKKAEGYPTALYSTSENKIYYNDLYGNKTFQLFERDLKNLRVTQLTKQFDNVDFLELDEKKHILFMRVLLKKEDRNFHVATYNLTTHKIQVWNQQDTDTSVKKMDYNPATEQLLVVSNSYKEEYGNVDKANKKGVPPVPPVYKLSLFDENGKKEKDVISLKTFITGVSLSQDGQSILISYTDSLDPAYPRKIASINVKSGKLNLLLQDSKEFFSVREPQYNQDKSGFYFLANDKDRYVKNEISHRLIDAISIKFYDIKNRKIYTVWSRNDENPVNFYVENKNL